MKDIKVKEHNGKPKTKNPVSRMPKELARTTLLETKEKSHQISNLRESGMEQESPVEYASEKLTSAEEWAGSKTASAAYQGGRTLAKKSREKIRERNYQKSVNAEQTELREVISGNRANSGNTDEKIKIKVKNEQGRDIPTSSRRTVKTAPRKVKVTPADKIKLYQIQKKQAEQTMSLAKQTAMKSARTAQTAERTSKATAKGITALLKTGATALKGMAASLGAGGVALVVVLVLIVGIIGGALFSGSSNSSAEPLSQEVLAHTASIRRYASEYGLSEYVPVIQAIMMQESGGRGTDPMQCSECPYNKRYPNTPGAITDPEYSIQVGIQYYADCVKEAGCTGPQDMEKLKLSLQGYNYGNGYISWAIRKFGGYSEANALQFSQEQAASHGWSGYGDPEYVPHVLRYYSGGNLFGGLFGNEQIVSVAMSQLGNEGGQKFWSWYGFSSREEWCACFVSWCADQSGLIESGKVPKFSSCSTGMSWFQGKGKWQSRGYTPTPGTIIFFDWGERDGNCDHVGIVEKCENGIVYTVEGNSGNAVKQRSYQMDSASIMGYGLIY